VATLASAGNPYPILYPGRRGKCDRLPIRGDVLFDHRAPDGSRLLGTDEAPRWDQRQVECYPGDVLVLCTDGLPEWHRLPSEQYGARFLRLIEELAVQGARAVGEAILEDWARHPRQPGSADDVTVAVLAVRRANEQRSHP
jgi:serine phosphatase RsbU (regulator of sigma subunit)